jgi:hypothetical protein
MRRIALTGVILACLGGYVPSVSAMPIEQPELPPVVQETVLQEAGSTALKRIELLSVEGRPVYEVVWQLGRTDIAILVDRDGRVLARDRRPAD